MIASNGHRYALPPGHCLGEYRIERYLGSGGFGITYAAIDENLGHRVAIKEYLPTDLAVRDADNSVVATSSEDEEDFQWGLDRFLDEARSLAQFDHPNIVRVQRFLRAHGTRYIVMEYVDGEPLSEMLKRSCTLTEAEIREHILPITDGLAHIHAGGVLHRDIKPGNIMIRYNGVPVLIDFGSAREAVSTKSRSVTSVLTEGYAPLEQYSTRAKQSPATDIYALGAVLYRCVTGETPMAATERVLEDRDGLIPVTEAAKGNYSAGLLTAIDAALRIRADQRPQDVGRFLDSVASDDIERRKSRESTNDTRKTNQSKSSSFRAGLIRAIAVMAFHLTVASFALSGALGEPVAAGQWVLLIVESLILGSITFAIGTAFHWSLGRVAYFRARRGWITWLVAAGAISGWSTGAEDVVYPATIATLTAVFGTIIWTAIFLLIGLFWRGLRRLSPLQTGAKQCPTAPRRRSTTGNSSRMNWAKAWRYITLYGSLGLGASVIVFGALTSFEFLSNGEIDSGAQPTSQQPIPITVITDPSDAVVEFRNRQEIYAAGMELPQGTYYVRVSAPGYETQSQFLVHTAQSPEHRIALNPMRQAFTVMTEPQEARVRILNISPVYEPGMMLSAGSYRVEVSAPGYETVVESVDHDITTPTLHRIELALSLAQLPGDGTAIGSLESGDYELPSGAYGDL